MSCMLRVEADGDAGRVLLESRLFGSHRFIEAHLGKRRRGRTSLNMCISSRDFWSFRAQVSDTVRFLGRYSSQLAALMTQPGVVSASLDFGVADAIDGGRGHAVAMFFVMPETLVVAAAALGFGLELSVYPVKQTGRTASRRGGRRSGEPKAETRGRRAWS
jgi:hypothetical protein